MRPRRHLHHPVLSPPPVVTALSRARQVIDADRWCAQELRALADIVGGVGALEDLALDPLEEKSFDWERVPSDDAPLVRELLDRIEHFCDRSVDPEFLIIIRRLLAATVTHDDHPLRRRRSSPQRIADALVWIALRGNMSVGRGQRYSGQPLGFQLGVTSCADLGRRCGHRSRRSPTR
jgi:hypothetical protein